MLTSLADIQDARRSLRTYLEHAAEALPAGTFSKLEALADSPSTVDAITKTAELLYARRDQLDDEGRTIVGQLASFAATYGWHGMAVGNRGGMIRQAMCRDLGLDPEPGQAAFQAVEDDPVPNAQYVVES